MKGTTAVERIARMRVPLRRLRTMVALTGALTVALLVAACSPDAPPPDGDDGPRIAALSPAVAVILRDLQLEDHIVARHGWDLVLDRSLPVAGDQTGIDYEALLRARPTHIVLEWGTRPLPARLEQLARAHGWSVHNKHLLTLEDIQDAAQSLYQRFAPDPAPAWEQTPLAMRLGDAFALRPDAAAAGRILLLASVRPAAALGPGSAHHQVLEAIGGRPALAQGGPFMTLDAEDVLRLAPEGIILIMPRPPGEDPSSTSAERLREQLGRIGTLDIPAARQRRIALIDHPLGQLPSTALGEIAEEMAAILSGWAHESASQSGPRR